MGFNGQRMVNSWNGDTMVMSWSCQSCPGIHNGYHGEAFIIDTWYMIYHDIMCASHRRYYIYIYMEVSHKGGTAIAGLFVYNRKITENMMIWGSPWLRKPPCVTWPNNMFCRQKLHQTNYLAAKICHLQQASCQRSTVPFGGFWSW